MDFHELARLCDEARPSCNRCVKARRTCLGYKNDTDFLFRRYGGESIDSSSRQSTAKPVPQQSPPIPTPPDSQHSDFEDSAIEGPALAAFFYDFSVDSADRSLSRGYLDGLETLVAHAGPKSELAQACKIMAFASLGNKLDKQNLLERARRIYPSLLRSYQATISNAATSNTVQLLVTAILLGLYEMLTATEDYHGAHGAHVRGVTAIISREESPFDMAKFAFLANPLLLKGSLKPSQDLGFLCSPGSSPPAKSLDALLVKARPLVRTAEALLSSGSATTHLRHLIQDAMLVEEEYSNWPANQPEQWSPITTGYMSHRQNGVMQGKVMWAGRVDAYFDLYVAAIWNSYRKAHLRILDVIVSCAVRLGEQHVHFNEQTKANELVQGIAASIPYHVAKDPRIFLEQPEVDFESVTPGRTIGGMLLMYSLYVSSKLSVVSPQLQDYMREWLAWIGKHMGVGQATMLANDPSDIEYDYLVDGHVLLWAGMLIHPA